MYAIRSYYALLYVIAFYQRVAPAVLTRELMTDFGLGAAALGNLSAFYFYSYVAMQVPTGLLSDHWGPRRLLTLGAAVAAAGTLLFALAPVITSYSIHYTKLYESIIRQVPVEHGILIIPLTLQPLQLLRVHR